MNLDLIRKEILSLCFLNVNCLDKLYQEKLSSELFNGLAKHYIALMHHASKSKIDFNTEEYMVLNPDVAEIIFSNKVNSDKFDNLLRMLKVGSFKKFIAERTDRINDMLKSDDPSIISKAYNLMREEIDIYGSDTSASTFGELASNYDLDRKREFLDIGYKTFENLNIENTDLVIIAGRPAMGKTAFIINLLARIKKKGLFISLEMGDNQIMDRVVSYMSGGVPMDRIINKTLTDKQREQVTNGLKVVQSWETEIKSDTGFAVNNILYEMERAVRRGCKYIMIDYLQLIRGNNKNNRNLEVGDISISLKEFAKKHNVPVIVLSQLSRGLETRTDKRPMLSDLRDSGRLTACYTFSCNHRGLLKVS